MAGKSRPGGGAGLLGFAPGLLLKRLAHQAGQFRAGAFIHFLGLRHNRAAGFAKIAPPADQRRQQRKGDAKQQSQAQANGAMAGEIGGQQQGDDKQQTNEQATQEAPFRVREFIGVGMSAAVLNGLMKAKQYHHTRQGPAKNQRHVRRVPFDANEGIINYKGVKREHFRESGLGRGFSRASGLTMKRTAPGAPERRIGPNPRRLRVKEARAMPLIDLVPGQAVTIPALQLSNGQPFKGELKTSDGENLLFELSGNARGQVPERLEELYVVTWQQDGVQRACPVIVRKHTPVSLTAQVVIKERREAPRLRVDVHILYEPVLADNVKETAEMVMARVNTAAAPFSEGLEYMNKPEDPLVALQGEVAQLREIIQELVMNVADLTALVVGGAPPRVPGNQPRTPLVVLNCSSTGVGFIAADPLQEGDYMKMTLTLRTTPKTIIECMGVVVRSVQLEGRAGEAGGEGRRYDTGVRFTHIHENDRERLIHYLFKVQRKLLRDMKEAKVNAEDERERANSAVRV